MEGFHRQEESENFDREKSPIKEAYLLLNAHTPLELNNLYTKEDQKFFLSRTWDYNNPDLLVHKIKNIIEKVNPESLTIEEKKWREEILWYWYHHAMICAVWMHKDKEKAKEYGAKALELQGGDHPNKVTPLMYLLINDKLSEAEEFAKSITDESDKSDAAETIAIFKEKGFF